MCLAPAQMPCCVTTLATHNAPYFSPPDLCNREDQLTADPPTLGGPHNPINPLCFSLPVRASVIRLMYGI
jgi:hypothetical protein